MKPKHSIWFKSLAAFLAFIIVIQVLPLSALAENITNKIWKLSGKLLIKEQSIRRPMN